eukprot:TRINITY_DN7256_c0_g1_i2.p1 TRINITY_DN7256_c0_g1~~TRINITY_DN7256_c0_g1_i2.p1  ORF type:complete len:114 (-),score=10.05 TRINITY_DN7256_c0_g1_i2:759-1100(-)
MHDIIAKKRRTLLGSTGAERLDLLRGLLSVESSTTESRGAVTGRIGIEGDQMGTNNFINCLDIGPLRVYFLRLASSSSAYPSCTSNGLLSPREYELFRANAPGNSDAGVDDFC